MPDAFYVPDGDAFISTEWTRGPWDPNAQHAGPPAALVGRAIEQLDPPGFQVARFTMELLKPVPIAPLRVEVTPVRTGRRVQYVQASLTSDGTEIARASSWRIRTSEEPMPETPVERPPFAGPDGSQEITPDAAAGPSYFAAMEWRYSRGSWTERGPASVWMRIRMPIVEGEPVAPLSRVLSAADSGNGISAVLDFRTHLFINTELTVHLMRMPEGEWVCIDAETRQDASGVGLAQSVIWDEHRRIGAGAQALLVGPR
jgi:acyl-Coa thioesterase superfamily protein/acyl-CoA thioesterase superfamily protein